MISKNLKSIILINVFFLALIVIYFAVIFTHLKPGHFFLVHDQAIYLSKDQIGRSSYLISSTNNGIGNGIQYAVALPTLIFYSILLKVGLSVRMIEMILFPLCIFIQLSISYIGFFELYSLEKKEINNQDLLNVALLTFFFCLSIISQSATGGGLWSIGGVINYALIPFLIYLINKFLNNNTLSYYDAVILSLILYLSSIPIMQFAPLFIVLLVYIFVKLSFKKILQFDYKKIGFIFVLCLLLFSGLITTYLLELSFGSRNATFFNLVNSTAGLQSKGLLSMFLFYFSWVIYTPWEPRSVFTFSKYLFTSMYVVSVLSIYAVIFGFLSSNKEIIKKTSAYLILFAIAVFLGKAYQEPFGFLFNLLLKSNTAFTVIRSPDSKFGATIVFSLTAFFLHIFVKYHKSFLLKLYLLIITVIIAWPFFTGEAVLGRNVIGKSGDWITSVSPDYQNVLNRINSDPSIANVVPYPEMGYAFFIDDDNNLFIGQNRLSMLSSQPLIDPSLLEKPLKNQSIPKNKDYDFSLSQKYNVKYFVLYKNVYKQDWHALNHFRNSLISQLKVKKLIDNKTLELYVNQDQSFTPKISLKNNKNSIKFKYVNPTKYLITIDDLKQADKLMFLQSFNKNWKIYSADDTSLTSDNYWADFKFLFKQPLFDNTHTTVYSYANAWDVNPPINNQSKITLVLYYRNQSILNIGFLITFTTFAGCVIFIVISTIRKKLA